jgi:hypothetical protein
MDRVVPLWILMRAALLESCVLRRSVRSVVDRLANHPNLEARTRIALSPDMEGAGRLGPAPHSKGS